MQVIYLVCHKIVGTGLATQALLLIIINYIQAREVTKIFKSGLVVCAGSVFFCGERPEIEALAEGTDSGHPRVFFVHLTLELHTLVCPALGHPLIL